MNTKIKLEIKGKEKVFEGDADKIIKEIMEILK